MNFRFKFLNKRLFAIGVCLLMMLSIIAAPVAKAGSGDGSGGGKGNPLSLAGSSPANGEQDVPLAGEIKLSFNKNVVHMTVCDDNKQCFALYAEDATAVPLEVIMADDQMEPEKRRDIVLKPQQELAPGTSYTVKIAPALRAKNGTTLGVETAVTFTTGGTTPAAATEPASATGGGTVGSQGDTDKAGDTVSSDQGGNTPVSSEPKTEDTTVSQEPAEPKGKEEEALADTEAEITQSADSSDVDESAVPKPAGNNKTIPLVLLFVAIGWLGYRGYKKYRAQ